MWSILHNDNTFNFLRDWMDNWATLKVRATQTALRLKTKCPCETVSVYEKVHKYADDQCVYVPCWSVDVQKAKPTWVKPVSILGTLALHVQLMHWRVLCTVKEKQSFGGTQHPLTHSRLSLSRSCLELLSQQYQGHRKSLRTSKKIFCGQRSNVFCRHVVWTCCSCEELCRRTVRGRLRVVTGIGEWLLVRFFTFHIHGKFSSGDYCIILGRRNDCCMFHNIIGGDEALPTFCVTCARWWRARERERERERESSRERERAR